MHLQIKKEFAIIAKEKESYHSFPTIIHYQGELWLACRSGTVSDFQAHGINGKVLLFSANPNTPECWKFHSILFPQPSEGIFNELDAILSAPEPDSIFLATRDYEFKKRNDVYLSVGQTPVMTQRKKLIDISDQYAICFGHIRRTVSGDLLLPGYCGFSDEPTGTPILLASSNNGRRWALRSKVASSTKVGTRLTEYSLGYTGAAGWTILIRSETPPFYLYQSQSADDGRTWSDPQRTDLRGHAPMLLDFNSGSLSGHLVLYRDLSESEPGVSIGLSLDHGISWTRAGRLASYSGSIYDGGYGDLIQLEENLYLAVYYLCDKDKSPWIQGALFQINA